MTLTLVPPLPPQDTPPACDPHVTRIASAMLAAGITPARLSGYPALTATYAAPLAALAAARGWICGNCHRGNTGSAHAGAVCAHCGR